MRQSEISNVFQCSPASWFLVINYLVLCTPIQIEVFAFDGCFVDGWGESINPERINPNEWHSD